MLVGHEGPHDINIASGKPALRSLLKYHGKPGFGASVEFKIKEGPITMLSVGVTGNGKFKFIITEGPTRHFAPGIGHRAGALEKIASILGIECATVVRESAE